MDFYDKHDYLNDCNTGNDLYKKLPNDGDGSVFRWNVLVGQMDCLVCLLDGIPDRRQNKMYWALRKRKCSSGIDNWGVYTLVFDQEYRCIGVHKRGNLLHIYSYDRIVST